jgi:hypothetical protein
MTVNECNNEIKKISHLQNSQKYQSEKRRNHCKRDAPKTQIHVHDRSLSRLDQALSLNVAGLD